MQPRESSLRRSKPASSSISELAALVLAIPAVLAVGCDMPMFSIDAEVEDLCVRRPAIEISSHNAAGSWHDFSLDELDVELWDGLDTRWYLNDARLISEDVESLGFLETVEVYLEASGPGPALPSLPLWIEEFDGSSGNSHHAVMDPPVDVTDYWLADDGHLLMAVGGEWDRLWQADLELCFTGKGSYEADW